MTRARATAPPPGPLHVNANVVSAEIAPLRKLPFTGWLPVHPPDAAHVSVLLVVHESLVVPPEGTLVGFVDKPMVGGLFEPATRSAELAAPPLPSQAARNRTSIGERKRRTARVRRKDGESEYIGGVKLPCFAPELPYFGTPTTGSVTKLLPANGKEICWVSHSGANLHILTIGCKELLPPHRLAVSEM